MCRLDVTFDGPTADSELVEKLLVASDPLDGRGFMIPSREAKQDGSIEATIYVFEGPPPNLTRENEKPAESPG